MVHNNPRNKIEGAMLKARGMVAGVSDLIYLNPRTGRVQCLEVKTSKGSQQKEQVQWQFLIESFGFEYHIIRSYKEFKQLIDDI